MYAFERDADMFYAPHSVVQLSDGRLMMMDDGTGRPGCLEGDAADDQVSPAFVGCFSRAAIYSLDEAAGVAKLEGEALESVGGDLDEIHGVPRVLVVNYRAVGAVHGHLEQNGAGAIGADRGIVAEARRVHK